MYYDDQSHRYSSSEDGICVWLPEQKRCGSMDSAKRSQKLFDRYCTDNLQSGNFDIRSCVFTQILLLYSSAPDYKSCIILFCLVSGKYRYLHEGHCGGSGWIPGNTIEATIDDCRKKCNSRGDDVKFFAYVPGSTCACYKTECLNDDLYLDHDAYEILEDGKK